MNEIYSIVAILKILLNQYRTIDLVKVKTAISLTKLRLGDTLRFVVYHIERHILQAQRKHIDIKQLEERLKVK